MQILLQSWRPNLDLRDALAASTPPPAPAHRYLYDEQNRAAMNGELLLVNYTTIVAMALRGIPSKVIACGFGVSREAIDKRLRPVGLKNPPGVRGRPTSCPPATSRYSARVSAPAHR